MKKHLLLIAALICTAGAAQAQCTPDPLYADSLYGIWPDTVDNFAAGIVGQPYVQQINLIVPSDAGAVDPTFAGILLDSVALNNVTGLPPGLSYACASHTAAPCTYLTSQLGCAIITGTPTVTGEYPLTLAVTAYASLFGAAIPIQQEFGGYRIIVTEDGTSIMENAAGGLRGVQNVPNPFAANTMIEFQLARVGDVRVRVFSLLGEELWVRNVTGKAGVNRIPFERGDLQDGVYLYKVETGRDAFTGRMVLHR